MSRGQGAAVQAVTRRPVQVPEQLHFVAGRFVPSAKRRTFETLDPTTNDALTSVADGRAEDIDKAVHAARRAFDEGLWSRLPTVERAACLNRIADAIIDHEDELTELESLDVGMPIAQARGQAARAAENFRYFARVVEEFTGTAYRVGDSFLNYTIHKPVGVAGLITPWNTPFMLETWKVAPCLAAGNTCVLKPSEWAPLTATKLAELSAGAGLPAGVFNVVHGFGETCGAPLVAHPGVNVISFTGETATGRAITATGAATLKRYSFELGGKAPVVVFSDADFGRAVDAAVFGAFSLNGQRCTASARLLVEAPIYDEFVAAVAARAAQIRVGDPFDPTAELGPLIHPDHWRRVADYVEQGSGEGARLVVGGGRPPELALGNYFQATLFADVRPDMRIFQEEIFGPVVTATPFRTEEEAISLANAVEYGLAAYVWTRDLTRAHRVGQAIDAGMVWINSQNVRDLRTPFGGMKQSGIGREGGHFSFEFYSELETIHVALGDHPSPRLGVTPEGSEG